MADHACRASMATAFAPGATGRDVPQDRQAGQYCDQGQKPVRRWHAHLIEHALDRGGQCLPGPELQQAGMLFQRNVLQCLVDARQQLAVNAAHQQVQVGGERAFEGLQLQRAAEVSPDHRLQCRFQANCDIGSAGFNGHQCCVPIGQVQQA
ncbi:hypothetical protein G6F65_018916 [Rhizopus arrhizus]|nr:hypothetical protein G6F31_016377 [Rhizopus arrhizus]KAG1249960.1 hypothetical protein G6F65_018916 [Rhizopus arrhizus]